MKLNKMITLTVLATLSASAVFAGPANREENIRRSLEETRREMKEKGIEARLNAAKSEAQVISEVDRILSESNVELTRKELDVLNDSETLKSNKDKIELAMAISKVKQTTRGSYFAKSVVHLIKLANKATDAQVKKDILNMLDNAIPFMGMEGTSAQKAQMTLGIYAYGLATGKNAISKQSIGDANKLDAQLSYKAAEAAIEYTFGKELKGADLKAKLDEFLKNCMKRG